MLIKWKKFDNYCIQWQSLSITKAYVDNKEKFILWHNTKLVKIYDNAKDAKQEALALIESEPASFDTSPKRLSSSR